jgi:Ca2+-binding RTX toxin-like protein
MRLRLNHRERSRSLARATPLLVHLPRVIIIAGLAALFAVLVASGSHPPPRATPSATLTRGTLSQSNSKAGAAILTASNIGPGDSVKGTVTIKNTGTISGLFSLSARDLVDTPGPNDGELSDTLDLLIQDVTRPASPATVYSGKQKALTTASLGVFRAGESHTYRFTVSFPNGGVSLSPAGGQNAYQGSSMSVQYDWEASAPTLTGRCAIEQTGTERRDVLRGIEGGDRIFGRRGNDLIRGMRGADCLFGQRGNDSLIGGAGNGHSGGDSLRGGIGRDKLFGQKGGDDIKGGKGGDDIKGGKGGDDVKGGKGDDVINGGKGDDVMNGGKGDDVINCGPGDDVVNKYGHDRIALNCEKIK